MPPKTLRSRKPSEKAAAASTIGESGRSSSSANDATTTTTTTTTRRSVAIAAASLATPPPPASNVHHPSFSSPPTATSSTKKGGGKARGTKKYQNDHLLNIVEAILPESLEAWTEVARLYKQTTTESNMRDPRDLKRHFTEKLCDKNRKPTGSSRPKPIIARAQKIAAKIYQRGEFQAYGDEGSDMDESIEDELDEDYARTMTSDSEADSALEGEEATANQRMLLPSSVAQNEYALFGDEEIGTNDGHLPLALNELPITNILTQPVVAPSHSLNTKKQHYSSSSVTPTGDSFSSSNKSKNVRNNPRVNIAGQFGKLIDVLVETKKAAPATQIYPPQQPSIIEQGFLTVITQAFQSMERQNDRMLEFMRSQQQQQRPNKKRARRDEDELEDSDDEEATEEVQKK